MSQISAKICGGKYDDQFLLIFYSFHRTKNSSFRKIELTENLGIAVVYYLIVEVGKLHN